MNIKQASEQSGVSAPNIRFYEKEGLFTPARRQGNDYRDYTAGNIRTLKLIRMLRMLDVPLPTIKAVLRGEQPLQQALQAQQTVLEQQAAQLAAAMQFCADLARQAPQADTLDVDACLTRMESPAPQQGFFSGWLQDYCTLAQVQHQKHFFFIPQGSINTPQEFTAALQAYAEEKGMQFTLTKEGMYPEFSLDGIAYKAYRNPGKYRDEICCDAVHPRAAGHRTAAPAGKAAAHPAYRCAAGVHLCRYSGGRVVGDRRCRLALAGGAGLCRGAAGTLL